METMNFPAIYLGSSSMFAAFSTGRPTALVVDMGTDSSRVSPVVDGFSVRKAAVRSPKGGRYINSILKGRADGSAVKIEDRVEGRNYAVFTPQYEVLAKARGQILNCRESFRNMHIHDTVAD